VVDGAAAPGGGEGWVPGKAKRKGQAGQAKLLEDDRFKALFERPEFQVGGCLIEG
jgi:hypothetical protein